MGRDSLPRLPSSSRYLYIIGEKHREHPVEDWTGELPFTEGKRRWLWWNLLLQSALQISKLELLLKFLSSVVCPWSSFVLLSYCLLYYLIFFKSQTCALKLLLEINNCTLFCLALLKQLFMLWCTALFALLPWLASKIQGPRIALFFFHFRDHLIRNIDPYVSSLN